MSFGRPIRVTFLTFYYEAWDALSGVYELMVADPRFEVQVVAISRKLTGQQGFDDAAGVSEFFESRGIAHQVNADLAGLYGGAGPDYIFVNYPWQRNYQKQYRPDQMAAIGRIAYVPYFSLPLVQEPVDGVNPDSGFDPMAAHLYTQRMHQLASLVFTQDEYTREAFAGTQRGNAHVYFVGSTKLDELIAELAGLGGSGAGSDSAKKTLVWAPHHSYSRHWLNFGTFAVVKDQMLDWAAAHPELNIVLRPHPFLFGTLVDRSVMSASELDAWLAAWNGLPNTSIDATSTSAEIFAMADYVVCDGISYLAEWPLATGNSTIFLENPEHWKFSPLGELAAATTLKISSVAELDGALAAIDAGVGDGVDGGLDRSAQIAALRAGAMPNPGKTAQKILEAVLADFASGSELVDVAAITEIPWELQSNREPQQD
jgi:hypothetical protein